MPTATVDPILRPEELVEYFVDLIADSTLPFEYVAKYDEKLIPKYPAVQVQPGITTNEPHATHTRLTGLHAFFYVMHANMKEDRRSRSLEDLLLVTQLKAVLESDVTLGGRIIHGFVDEETPAVFPPRVAKGDIVVGTRMSWSGVNQYRWR
jgi:hypothetical protein